MVELLNISKLLIFTLKGSIFQSSAVVFCDEAGELVPAVLLVFVLCCKFITVVIISSFPCMGPTYWELFLFLFLFFN